MTVVQLVDDTLTVVVGSLVPKFPPLKVIIALPLVGALYELKVHKGASYENILGALPTLPVTVSCGDNSPPVPGATRQKIRVAVLHEVEEHIIPPI